MLAGKAELAKLQFPVYASPKLDGIRALVIDGVVVSRKLLPIPNKGVQQLFGRAEYNGFDGELIVGEPTSPTAFRDTTSVVMSHDKPASSVYFWAFDNFAAPGGWHTRYHQHVLPRIGEASSVLPVRHWMIANQAELERLDEDHLGLGFEGTMLRSVDGPYKQGRSTTNEGYLLKLKQFLDDEAMVVGFEELMHNGNEALKDNLGRTKRSSAQAGKSGLGKLGAVILRRPDGVEFNVGTGFNDAERTRLWDGRDDLLGKFVKYRYFPSGGKDKPRFPTFVGFRHPIDMGD